MKRLLFQLKDVRQNKMCLLTFFLPVIAGIAVNLLSGVNFQSVNEISFGAVKNTLATETTEWLRQIGNVAQYETPDGLWEAVNNPSTQMIGVLKDGDGISTVRSGDELQVTKVIADTLPRLYDDRTKKNVYEETILPVSGNHDGLRSLLIVITLVTAMFMGCTFNAMSIIGEKEDGISQINRILPMSAKTYIAQKIFLGLIGSTLSTVLTACICMKIEPSQMVSLSLVIVLSACISALAGLYIGHFSEGLMTGIVYIKALMILFLAPPVFFYLMVPEGSAGFLLSYLLPSSAAFYGLMALANGAAASNREIIILAVHGAVWFLLYLPVAKRHN